MHSIFKIWAFGIGYIGYLIGSSFSEQEPTARDIVELSACRVLLEECSQRPGMFIYSADLEIESTGKKFRARVVYKFKEEEV